MIKTYFQRLVKFLLTQFAVLDLWLNRHENPNPEAFDDLSPIDNTKSETYDKALEWALKNVRIKNIAVTGPYGSGKSSILKTFEKKHPGYYYLNISLASFTDEEGNKLPDDVDEKNRLIELSIIQQMFYRVKNRKIPDSRFNRIRNLSFWRIALFSLFSLAFVIALLIFFDPVFLKRISWWDGFSKQHGDWLIYAAILLALPAIFKVQAYILRLLNTSKFNKINLTKGEVEFDNKSETSVLNMHLDEILYFFEVTNYNVVVFEDLDRFNDPEIFTKLRELNILINKSLQIGRHIVFIYAIKDDMFRDKTRTKFFDFIIPVIPVINWSNSYEIMMGKFGQKDLKLTVSEKFISAITLYIDDMRALKNIFNEFMLYKENLKDIEPNQDKLLAIIVYKNIFPNEFADLHENRGIIYEAFQQKPAFVKTAIENKQLTIKENKERINQFKETLAESVLELRAIYLLAFQGQVKTASSLHIKNIPESFTDIQQSDEKFDWLMQQDNIGYYHYTQHPHYGNNVLIRQQTNSNISFKTVENSVNSELTYRDRAQLINNEIIQEIDLLDKANHEAELEISQLQSFSLKELLDTDESVLTRLSAELQTKKLLVYLVREGYIDENYPSLISYFYEGSLTYRDMAFIRNIRDREILPFNYELNTTENILKRLEPVDFARSQILNFTLVDYLLENHHSHKENLNKVMGQLANHTAYSLSFVEEYIQHGKVQDKFFDRLFSAWPGLWDYIDEDPTYVAERKNTYLKLIITHASTTNLTKLNAGKKLEKYIKNLPGILNWFTEEKAVEKLKKVIELFKLKFYKLDKPEGTDLFDYIIEQRNYMLTEDMILLIIQQKGADVSKNEELITTANYTAVQLSEFQPLITYVEENLSDYIESVTLLLPKNTKDTEAMIVTLLNKENISDDIKERIIDKEEAIIADIKVVPGVLWPKLLNSFKTTVRWPNMIAFYEASDGINETLASFFNQKKAYTTLSKEKLNKDKTIDESVYKKFTRAYLLDNAISDEAYESLISSAPYFYTTGLVIENLSERKVKALINSATIRLDPTTFGQVKTTFPELLGLLIEKNIDEYLKDTASFPLEAPAFAFLFNSSLPPEKRTVLISLINDTILDSDAALSGSVAGHLLQYTTTAQPTSATLQILMKHNNLLTRRQLFDKFFKVFNYEELGPILLFMGNDFKLIEADGTSFVVESDELNISIAKKIKQAGLIYDWKNKNGELTLIMNKKTQEDI
jgi:hypothetical protein